MAAVQESKKHFWWGIQYLSFFTWNHSHSQYLVEEAETPRLKIKPYQSAPQQYYSFRSIFSFEAKSLDSVAGFLSSK